MEQVDKVSKGNAIRSIGSIMADIKAVGSVVIDENEEQDVRDFAIKTCMSLIDEFDHAVLGYACTFLKGPGAGRR